MDARYIAHLQRAFSRERLMSYRPAGGDDVETAANYLWNIALCEALYPTLQVIEVALRNSMHNAASALLGTPYWFDPPFMNGPKRTIQRDQVAAARENWSKNERRKHPRGSVLPPATPGQLVAELMFGFWTGLMNRPFITPFWPAAPTANNPGILAAVFPHVPTRYRSREPLFHRFERIRILRNRVFHYEHVWDWRQPPLGWQPAVTNIAQQHAEAIEALRWISPVAADTLQLIDRFPTVYVQRRAYYRRNLDAVLRLAGTL